VPRSSARNTADSLSGVKTPRRPPRSATALAGTTSACFLVLVVTLTRAYIPGLRRAAPFGISISIGAVRVAGSSTGDTRAMRPVNTSPGNASTSTRVVLPVCSSLRSFSTTLATRRTMEMSTTSTTDTFCETNAPGSTERLDTKPVTGELMTVLPRLMRSSSRRAFDCEFCARARSTDATAD